MPGLNKRQTKSAAFSSPRHLVLRKSHARYVANQKSQLPRAALPLRSTTPTEDPSTVVPPLLGPGEEQLYSFYSPALKDARYHIEVNQTVHPPVGARTSQTKSLQLTSDTQQFEIVGPRFSLPPSDIQTVYPPQGHGDHLRILPHVVFNDPHIPWERDGSKDTTDQRNMVPWLALLVFTQDELRLNQTQMASFPAGLAQSTTLSISMTLNDVYGLVDNKAVVFPVQRNNEEDPITDEVKAAKNDFIFVPSDLFESFVAKYKADGTRDPAQTNADVSRYKFLAHVRNINTQGMALAAGDQPEQGLYSVVVAHRVGPWDIKRPTPVVVHLVSIEGVEDNIAIPVKSQAPLVALSSLYSWTYQCLPPDSLDFFDAMTDLANTVSFLRPAPAVYSSLAAGANPTAAQKRLAKRMEDGYSLTRYLAQTGEETVAFTRGPFVPAKVTHALKFQSTFATDLQILDRTLGIMDISYASAWELGKTMAVADQAFTATVSRIRTAIHDQAMQAAKATVLSSVNRTASQIASSLQGHINTLAALTGGCAAFKLDPERKWNRPSAAVRESLSFFSPAIRDDGQFLIEAEKVARRLASSTDSTDGHYLFYNEHNQPASTDWAHMLAWILDRMSFFGIPAHYLITDPSHLPHESLRFFIIDPNWVDAFIDGALSIANHLEQDDDSIRTAIKTTLTDYFDKVDPQIGFAPQIPKSGFLLRSAVVKQFPHLVLSAPWPDGYPGRAEILRQENIDEEVMLVLFDRVPGDGLLTTLTLSQPPHQQCFAAANHVGPDEKDATKEVFEMTYGQVYTIDKQPVGQARRQKLDVPTTKWTNGEASPGFDWSSRTLIFPNFAQIVLDNISTGMHKLPKTPDGDPFTDTVPSAALVGIQLNDKMCQISIEFPTVSANTNPNPNVAPATLHTAIREQPDTPDRSTGKTLSMVGRTDKFNTAEAVRRLLQRSEAYSRSSAPASAPSSTTPAYKTTPVAPPTPTKAADLVSSHVAAIGPPVRVLAPPPAGSIPPQYKISCLLAGNLQNKTGTGVPTLSGYPIDLVFTVRNVGDASKLDKQGLRIAEVRLVIPLGDVTVKGKLLPAQSAAMLTRRMLRNLRWNALLTPGTGKDSNTLLVQLLPRSSSGAESILRSGDVSFVLGQVDVNPYKIGFQMNIKAFEIYEAGGERFSVENSSCRVDLRPGK
jgi:hypothetical protein